MAIVVTGGAGYIGAHLVRILRDQHRAPIVVDDFSTGRRAAVADVPTFTLDLTAADAATALAALLADTGAEAVVHLAAKKRADESLREPLRYYEQNVGSTRTVLAAMASVGTRHLVYSSSAAVYGTSSSEPLNEEAGIGPTTPYGRTKLVGEWLVRDCAGSLGIAAAALRYFNVAGAGWDDLADPEDSNLVTATLARLSRGEAPAIFGADYDTPDGTCVRDFVHVVDVAEAHVAALDFLTAHEGGIFRAYNVGTGRGTTVRQVAERLIDLTRTDAAPTAMPRRPGDVPSVFADPQRIAREIGWRTRFGLEEILASSVSGYLARGSSEPRH